MPFVSITRLRVRSWRYVPVFLLSAMRITRQARDAEGNLGVRVLRDKRNVFWTGTSWQTEAAMKQFMGSAPHGPAMRKLLVWCDEAALVHWNQVETELPSWTVAHQRMQHEGRPSKVYYPSKAQTAYVIPLPASPERREVVFK
jgi:hypothetical protein